jgi:two-component sensor histidine kinase
MPGPEDANLSSLQERCRSLEAQVEVQRRELSLLCDRFERYETALHGAKVTVFTQDRDLRYVSISSAMLGRPVDAILGHTDEELFPSESRTEIIAAKLDVLATGRSNRTEISLPDGPGARWHDLRIEPLRDERDKIVGLAGVLVDVTERKESEAHLRLLLRELTHRSKNLLAVIQAMARQSARHTGSVDGFLAQFGSRLQALAASHDLLVHESWRGASLRDLIRTQLASYVADERVAFEGPDIDLKPEAAQSLGLAIHELASNAVKFGALSVPDGQVSINWARANGVGTGAVAIDWRERNGPKVKARRKHGFGSMVIERNLARALDADVELTFDPDGLRCHIVIPGNQILTSR